MWSDNLKFNKTLIALLAIFVIVVGAGMVCAVDVANDTLTNQNAGGDDTVPPVIDQAAGGGEDEDINETEYEVNETDGFEDLMMQGSVLDAESYDSGNWSDSADESSVQVSDTHATGNPLLVLLIAVAGIGVSSLRRRK